MLINFLKWVLGIFLDILSLFLDHLPAVELTIPEVVTDFLVDVFSGVGYFLPLNELMPLFYFWLFFYLAKIMWSLIIRIKSFIPTMGA